MKKKLIPYVILATVLLLLVIIAQIFPTGRSRIIDLLKFNNRATMRAFSEFHIRDTASIDKIFMVDKLNQSITLSKVNKSWIVKKEDIQYPARYDAVKLLLYTLHTMRVKMPVAISAQEEILRKMAGRSIKVEVYSKGRHLKTFYVGGVTQDNLGTYMLMEGADIPFVVEIPGFRGFIASRFSTDILNWRSNILLAEPHEKIKKIEVKYPDNPKAGFTVVQPKPRQYQLFDFANQPAKSFDSLAVKGFMEQFEIAHFDRFVNLKTKEEYDSVLNSKPLIIISLKDQRDSLQTYRFYEIPAVPIDEEGEMTKHLYPQSMWVINNKGDWVIVQTYTYLLMFRHCGDFKPKF